MIYTLSKKIVLCLALFLSVWFSFADTDITSFWSAEWRDQGMIKNNIEKTSCEFKNWACCRWNSCQQIFPNCLEWTTVVIKWCDVNCNVISECKKIKTKSKDEQKIEIEKTKEEKVRETLTKSFNIKTENKSKDEILNSVKTVKVEKINNIWSKLESVLEKTENLNYNSTKLKWYIEGLNNIKYGLNQDNLSIAEKKKYNIQLKNTMNNIKQELDNIKRTYSSL
jgi:hypothetical protein